VSAAGLVQDHADAMLALLRNRPGLVVYPDEDGAAGTGQGRVPAGAEPPYVSVHFYADRVAGGTWDMRSSRMIVVAYVNCVGANDVAARAVADQVAAAWLDARPQIDGRNCYPIRHDGDNPAINDESTGSPVVNIRGQYRLESLPGPE
jgi:hypothetical protein